MRQLVLGPHRCVVWGGVGVGCGVTACVCALLERGDDEGAGVRRCLGQGRPGAGAGRLAGKPESAPLHPLFVVQRTTASWRRRVWWRTRPGMGAHCGWGAAPGCVSAPTSPPRPSAPATCLTSSAWCRDLVCLRPLGAASVGGPAVVGTLLYPPLGTTSPRACMQPSSAHRKRASPSMPAHGTQHHTRTPPTNKHSCAPRTFVAARMCSGRAWDGGKHTPPGLDGG
jgi:hypothetical protein